MENRVQRRQTAPGPSARRRPRCPALPHSVCLRGKRAAGGKASATFPKAPSPHGRTAGPCSGCSETWLCFACTGHLPVRPTPQGALPSRLQAAPSPGPGPSLALSSRVPAARTRTCGAYRLLSPPCEQRGVSRGPPPPCPAPPGPTPALRASGSPPQPAASHPPPSRPSYYFSDVTCGPPAEHVLTCRTSFTAGRAREAQEAAGLSLRPALRRPRANALRLRH